MKNKIDTIVREVTFNAPIQQVWNALTDPKEIQLWFGSAATFELERGALGYFEWEEECEGRFAMRVETIEEPTYFSWRWMFQQDAVFDQAESTLVEWTLKTSDSGGTLLRLTESGFAEAKHRQANIQGWEQELADLEAYMEKV